MPKMNKNLVILFVSLLVGAFAVFMGLRQTNLMLQHELVRDAKDAATQWSKYVFSAEPKLAEIFLEKTIELGVSDVFHRTYPAVRTIYYELYDDKRDAFFISYMNVKFEFKRFPKIDEIIDRRDGVETPDIKVAFHHEVENDHSLYFATVAVPYISSGKLVGYLVSYIDQTNQRAQLEKSFGYIAILIVLFCAISIIGPISILILKSVEERKAKQAIRISEELFSKAFNSSPVQTVISDLEKGTYFDVNDKWLNAMGYTREEIIGRSALDLGIWSDSNDRRRFIELLEKKGSVRGFEASFRTKSGEELFFLHSGEIVDIGGRPRLLSASYDITARKQAEKALLESEQHFRNLIEGSIQGVFIVRDWNLLFANTALAEIFGYESSWEILALKNIEPLLAPEERERINGYKYARENGEYAPEIYECKGVKKDGEIIDVEFRVRKVEWRGKPAVQCVVIDITDRKRAQTELIEHRDQLQSLVDKATEELRVTAEQLRHSLEKERELNELQRQFVSMASHEFRTPLSIIDMSAQRIKSKADKNNLESDDVIIRIDKIRSSVRRMTRLMESTLAAAKMFDGEIRIEVARCDIKSLAADVCANQQELTDAHIIHCELSPDLPDHIRADHGAVEQVLTNLLSNAVKYSLENAKIQVAARTEGKMVAISVRDYGIGIDTDDLDRIGDRFFRAKTSTGIAGTGIGLNLCKKLLALHEGSLDVQSSKGNGSTFTVKLPIAGPAHKKPMTVENSQLLRTA